MDTLCPHCNSVWSISEIDLQECESCGFPDHPNTFDVEEEYKRPKPYTKPEYNIFGKNDDTND